MHIVRISLLVAPWITFSGVVEGAVHNMLISSYQTPEIFSLSFDDYSNNFQLERVLYGHAGHPWLALNRDKTILYGAEKDGWSSYQITSPVDVRFSDFIPVNPKCKNAAIKHGVTIMTVSKFPPYPVYGAGRSPCGAVIATRPDGRLDRIVQEIPYEASSRVQGMAVDPRGRWLFSADGNDNGIWVHQINPTTGALDRGEAVDFPINDAKPRRIVMHPDGRFLYILLQRTSQVAVFEFLPGGGGQRPSLRYTNLTISLIPSGVEQNKYRATELQVSEDGRVLYGTVRYRQRRDDSDSDGEWFDSSRIPIPRASSAPKGQAASLQPSFLQGPESWTLDSSSSIAPSSSGSSSGGPLSNIFGWGRGSETQIPAGTLSSNAGSGRSDREALTVNDDDSDGPGIGAQPGLVGTFLGSKPILKSKLGKLGLLFGLLGRRSVQSKKPTQTLEEFVLENTHTVLRRSVPDEVDTEIPDVKERFQTSNPGFVTAILLSAPSNGPKGMPMSVLMQAATGTSGGRSNIVAPAPWNSGQFALVDSEMGLVQVWKLDGLTSLPRDGPRGNFQQLGYSGPAQRIDPGYASVRASIVAEWRAPQEVVGNPLLSGNSDRDNDGLIRPSVQPADNTYQDYPPSAGQPSDYNRPYDNDGFIGPSTQPIDNTYQYYQPSTGQASGYNTPYDAQNLPDPYGYGRVLREQEDDEDGTVFQKRQLWGSSYSPQTPTNAAPSPIPSGRGCCANAIWLN